MEFELFEDDAPGTVDNFCDLVNQEFYNGLIFHQYIPETLIQTGCPIGDGTGGPGYFIKCELRGKRQFHDKGVLSMANSGRDTNGSQFIICLDQANVKHLDGNHTCFGKLRKTGLEILSKLRRFDIIEKIEIGEVEEIFEMNERDYQQ